jgi:hypothetical protein
VKSETEEGKRSVWIGDEIGEGFPVRIFFGEIRIFRWPFEINNLVLECVQKRINQKGKERITESENGYGDL